MTASALRANTAPNPGFGDPVHDAQAVFRSVLRAMSRPGEVQDLSLDVAPPAPLFPAAAGVCLALLDLDTRLWIGGCDGDAADAAAFVAFHTGAPATDDVGQADFAVIADGMQVPALDTFRQGTDEAPENSATVIVQVSGLDVRDGTGAWRLSGPGIDGETSLHVEGVRQNLVGDLAANRARFPRGVDLILCTATGIAALPRTTKVEV